MYRYIGIPILVVLVVCGTGCDYDGYIGEDMAIKAAYLVSVSSVRPAEVTIGVIGWNSDTCVGSEAKVYASREGNKIYLSAPRKSPDRRYGLWIYGDGSVWRGYSQEP